MDSFCCIVQVCLLWDNCSFISVLFYMRCIWNIEYVPPIKRQLLLEFFLVVCFNFSLKLSNHQETVQHLVFYRGLLCLMLFIFGILSGMFCDLLEEQYKHSCRKLCTATTPGKVYLGVHWGPES